MDTSTYDPYAVLGVSPGASRATIEAAYRRLSLRYHPDRNRHPDAERRMKEINAAYEVLVRRRRASTAEAPPPSPPRAEAWRSRPPRGSARPGAPLLSTSTTQLDLGEVASGTTPLGRVEVRNLGGGLLSGAVSTSTGWLRCTPATFNANRLTVQVFAVTDALAADEAHRGTLTIRSTGGVAQVEVTVRVRQPRQPEIVVQPATILLGNRPEGLVTTLTIAVRTAGSGTLHGTAVAQQPWLRVEPARFVGSAITLTVTADMRPLMPGLDHYSAVELRTNAGTVQVPVQVYVAPQRGLAGRMVLQWRALAASGRRAWRRLSALVR
jgi:hypothetical protein